MPLTKSEYNLNGGVATFDDAVNAVNSQTSFHLTTFLNSSPNNKVIFVYAGFNPNVGGYAEMSGQKLIVREKLDPNTQTGSCRSVIDGISIICHEYGHLLGWNHTSLGNYCIMNTGSDNQN
ncbi:MAG: hypothetical protein IT281_08225, partial [Ignavibacteria bacterium]|nr:hypothetical protein [Ignavibacteria bacterium]